MNDSFRRGEAKLITGLFCFGLFSAGIISAILPQKQFSDTENRSLAEKPKFHIETFLSGKFGKQYEDYLSDQFPGRNSWIRLKTAVNQALLMEESKGIYFAEDHYLIERHSKEFDTPVAKGNCTTLAQFCEMALEQYGEGHVLCTIVPNAVEILTDRLPLLAPDSEEGAFLESIAQMLPKSVWLDTSEVLKEHREEEIFYKTDHHWTTLGAFYAAQKWQERMGVPILDTEDFEISVVTDAFMGTVSAKLNMVSVTDSIEVWKTPSFDSWQVEDLQGNISGILHEEELATRDKYGVFFGGNQPLLRLTKEDGNQQKGIDQKEKQDAADKKLLVLKDSYANCFVPFLLDFYDEIDLVDLRYYNAPLSDLMSEEGYQDVLILYNASGFAGDASIGKMLT